MLHHLTWLPCETCTEWCSFSRFIRICPWLRKKSCASPWKCNIIRKNHDLVFFSLVFWRFRSEKLWFSWKLIWYSESASKTESTYVCCKYFRELLFSSKNSPLVPLRVLSKMNFIKTLFLLFSHLPFWVLIPFYNLRTCFLLLKYIFDEIHFLTHPWGGPRASFFDENKSWWKHLKLR